MPAPRAATPADRLRVRQIVMCTILAAALVVGLLLYFRFSGRVVPLLDAVSEG